MKQKLLNFTRLRSLVLLAVIAFLGAGQAWGEDTYTKVTTAPSDWSGTYVIVADASNVIFTGQSGSNNYGGYATVTITDNSVTGNFAAYEVEVEASGDYYSIKHLQSSKYLGWTSGNYLFFNTTAPTADSYRWVLSTNSILNANDNNRKLQYNSGSPRFACYTSSQKVAYLYKKVSAGSVSTPTFSPAGGTYASTQSITLSTTTEGATIYYTIDGTDPTTSSSTYSSAISVSSTTTIKAMAVKSGMGNSSIATATYTIVNIEHAGNEADPYTVADARAAIDANTGIEKVYVSGIISQVDSYDSNHKSITYWISDDGTTTNQLEVYSGKGLSEANFSSVDDIVIGASVVVYGTLKKYNSTYEFDYNNYLVSYTAPVTPYITANDINITYDATSGSISYEIENEPDPAGTLSASVPDGSWLALGTVTSASVPFTCEANATATNRTATVTLTYTYDNKTVTKNVTVTQAGNPNIGSITFGSNDTKINGASVTGDDSAGNTWTITTVGTSSFTANSAFYQVGSGNNPATSITFTTTLPEDVNVTAFEAKFGGFNGTVGDVSLKVGNTEIGTGALNGGTDVTITNTSSTEGKVLTVTVTGIDKGVKCYYISYTAAPINHEPAAPVWSELPTPSVVAGSLYEIDLATYVSGYPTPSISLSTSVDNSQYDFENGLLEFQPESAGTYIFNFTATNDQGSQNATLTVTATNPTLTVSTLNDHINAIYVFDAENQNDPLIDEGEAGTIQVAAGTDIIVSPDVEDGYVLKSLTVVDDENNSVQPEDHMADGGYYSFTMPSGNVTISATAELAPVTNTYTLATSITSGKHYIIVGVKGENYKALGQQNSNNRASVDVEYNNGTISAASNAGVTEFAIYGPDADGYYTIYDADNGYLYAVAGSNYLKSQSSVSANSQWTVTFDGTEGNAIITAPNVVSNNQARVIRYNSTNNPPIFSCYITGQSDIYLYKKSGEATPTETKTVNAKGYATYCSQNALDFANATGGTAWAITEANSSTGVITFNQIAGAAPAGTGMLLMGSGTITMPSASGSVSAITNLLEGTTADKDVVADEYYGLSGDQFVKVNAGTVPAGKALLPASEVSSNVKSFTFVFEGADGIKTVKHVSAEQAAEIFNLAGQRLSKAQKGVNIINGKKVLVK